jgi:hypothetical protein
MEEQMKNALGRIENMTSDALRDDLAHFDTVARGFMQERPLVAVAAALGIGYVLGRVVARR